MTTYRDITAQIAKLQAEAEKLRSVEKAGVIGRIREAIDLYAISASDLGFGKPAKGAAAPRSAPKLGKPAKTAAPQFGVPKYRDPDTGKTWTGRGKPPTWIAGAKDRTPFLISSAPTGGGDVVNNGKRQRRAPLA